MTFELYAWKAPRDLDDEGARALVDDWQEAGGDPAASPFEPSTDVGWFFRELMQDEPALEAASDAVPTQTRTPIWLSGTDEPPARVVGLRASQAMSRESLDTIFSLAAKYDLVLFDARSGSVHHPLEEMAVHASATFWPAGAIQAAVAGGIGGAIAVGAWLLGISLISGLVALAGGLMFVMAVFTFVHEGRKAVSSRIGR